MTSPALALSRKLGRRRIEPRLRVGDALHLGDELVAIEDHDRMELLERENAFLAIGRPRLLGTFGRICSHVARPFEVAQRASAPTAHATETPIAIIRSSRGSRHRRQPRCVGSAEVLLQPAGLGTDLSRGDSQAPPAVSLRRSLRRCTSSLLLSLAGECRPLSEQASSAVAELEEQRFEPAEALG
jgi:hypothetical protein